MYLELVYNIKIPEKNEKTGKHTVSTRTKPTYMFIWPSLSFAAVYTRTKPTYICLYDHRCLLQLYIPEQRHIYVYMTIVVFCSCIYPNKAHIYMFIWPSLSFAAAYTRTKAHICLYDHRCLLHLYIPEQRHIYVYMTIVAFCICINPNKAHIYVYMTIVAFCICINPNKAHIYVYMTIVAFCICIYPNKGTYMFIWPSLPFAAVYTEQSPHICLYDHSCLLHLYIPEQRHIYVYMTIVAFCSCIYPNKYTYMFIWPSLPFAAVYTRTKTQICLYDHRCFLQLYIPEQRHIYVYMTIVAFCSFRMPIWTWRTVPPLFSYRV